MSKLTGKKKAAQIAPNTSAGISTTRKDPTLFPHQEKILRYRTKVSPL